MRGKAAGSQLRTTAEQQHAQHEDHALNHHDPLPDLRQDSCIATTMKAPAGADTVPSPPTSAIGRSPDIGQSNKLMFATRSAARSPWLIRRGRRASQKARRPLVAIGLVAERDRARLVLAADGLEDLAEWRMDDAVISRKPARKMSTTVTCVIGHRRAEQLAARHVDACFTTVRIWIGEEEHHLRQRQRDHGEVDALPGGSQQTGDDANPQAVTSTCQDHKLAELQPWPNGGDLASRNEARGQMRQAIRRSRSAGERAGEQREGAAPAEHRE